MFNVNTSGSTMDVSGVPTKKCAGVRTQRSSGFSVCGNRGLEFIIAEI